MGGRCRQGIPGHGASVSGAGKETTTECQTVRPGGGVESSPAGGQAVVTAPPQKAANMVMLYMGVGYPLGGQILQSTKNKVWAGE